MYIEVTDDDIMRGQRANRRACPIDLAASRTLIEEVRQRIEQHLLQLERQHTLALERNDPTLHPLALAIRIEEVNLLLAMLNQTHRTHGRDVT